MTTHLPNKLILVLWLCPIACSWLSAAPPCVRPFPHQHQHHSKRLQRPIHPQRQKVGIVVVAAAPSDVVDAEFEPVLPENDTEETSSTLSDLEDSSTRTFDSLFDLSLDSGDQDWKRARIPFVEPTTNRCIDGKLAFTVDLGGVTYGIAVPQDHAVAVTVEEEHENGPSRKSNGRDVAVRHISPDDEDGEELIQIMASQLQEHVSKDLTLIRTPRILTVSGPLERYTENWMDKLLPKPIETDALLNGFRGTATKSNSNKNNILEEDEDVKGFLDFMKKELGEEEVRKTLEGEDDDVLDDELMSLFHIPGFGDEGKDDIDGMEELIESMLKEKGGKEDLMSEVEEVLGKDLKHDGVALKLISYRLPDMEETPDRSKPRAPKKVYSLVQLLKPYTLIGRYVPPDGDYLQDLCFELLTHEEEELIIPRLEQVCEEDLRRAGLEFGSIQASTATPSP